MNHPFLTRRTQLQDAQTAAALVDDVVRIVQMSESDHKCIRERKDSEVKDGTVRKALMDRSPRLGLVLEDLAQVSTHTQKIASDYATVWSQFLATSKTDTTQLQSALEAARPLITGDIRTAEEFERDDGASSESDYSDSRTESSSNSHRRRKTRGRHDDPNTDEEEGEEEEGEEEEDD